MLLHIPTSYIYFYLHTYKIDSVKVLLIDPLQFGRLVFFSYCVTLYIYCPVCA